MKLLAFLLFAATTLFAAATIEKYTVLLSSNPSTDERYTANLLKEYLGKCAETDIALLQEPAVPADPVISIGETTLAKQCGFIDMPDANGYILEASGDNYFLRGGNPGLLFGAISLLEEDLGCRWYAHELRPTKEHYDPGLEVTPSHRGKTLSLSPRRYTPPFSIREILYMYGANANRELTMFLRLAPISYHSFLPEDSGSVHNSHLFIHTYARLLPAKKYFAEHPEYFAMRHGKRVPQKNTFGAVCYSNPAVPGIMTEGVREAILAEPGARYFSVSCNDGGGSCECPECSVLINKHTLAGVQLVLVNKIAELLVGDYPDIRLTTLVYSSDDVTKAGVYAHPCVVPFVAPINTRYNQISMLIPISELPGVTSPLINARKAAKEVIYWDYLDDSRLPYPTFDQFAQTVRWLAEQNISGYFADCTCGGVSLAPLKKWVFAHLLWNPSLDMEALIDEFIKAYYGSSANEIAEYVSIIRKAWRRFKTEYDKTPGQGITLVYTADELSKMRKLFEKAWKDSAQDDVLHGRIAREYIVFLTKMLAGNPVVTGMEQYTADYARALECLPYLPWNANVLSQKLPERWQKKLEWSTREPEPEQYSANSFIVWKPLTVDGMSEYIDDPDALDGKATRHFGKQPWGVQWNYRHFIDCLIPGKTYVLRMRIRADLKDTQEPRSLFSFHPFHHGNKSINLNRGVMGVESLKNNNDKYRWVVLGSLDFVNPEATGMFWLDTPITPEESVYYDYLEFIPLEEYKKPEEIPDCKYEL
ncbi:MAG: DUF4838 domain-containing protein [Oligosphaeraceae bacterium]|nr:DUF4838 domain-containing protein [Oligosphaeraceae bacterium]